MTDRASYDRSSTEVPTSPVGVSGFSPDGGSTAGDRDPVKRLSQGSTSLYDSVVNSEVVFFWR